jgi:hypothetical protein
VKHRVVLIGLSVVLAIVMFVSLRLTPASTQERLNAVPVYSQLIYNNDSPDWFLSFFPMIGMDGVEFSKGWEKSFRYLQSYPLAVATVPFGGRARRDTWVAVSELGGAAALAFRWRLNCFPPQGVEVEKSYAVWPVWSFEHSSIPSWAHVRFSVTESLLICSISSDRRDIYKLLDVVDGRAASFGD